MNAYDMLKQLTSDRYIEDYGGVHQRTTSKYGPEVTAQIQRYASEDAGTTLEEVLPMIAPDGHLGADQFAALMATHTGIGIMLGIELGRNASAALGVEES